MEMLRQSDFKDPGWAARTLDSVLLIAPDLSVDLFESQIRDLSHVPQPFGVIVSEKDAVLRVSAMLRGNVATGRLGNIASAQRLKDLPVEIIDITEFASDATAGHFVAATSPSLIAMIRSTEQITQSFEAPQQTFLGQLFPPSRASVLQDGKIRISRSEDR
ncbi:MAG: alpha/beta hydrolase, partial [Epibacterium sp.]|nr:alpha/beta hydrolase [Epibacterium sp.]NQX75664.1 alpha/beta hydrolase [Epibacterium sp.]